MANAVIFGLGFSTMLTLIVVPVLYSFTGGGLKKDENPDYKRENIFKRIYNFFKGIKK